MIFRYFDKLIDKKVANTFSHFRKIGRRSERVYYTAYKDFLVYCSRRSHDNSVKITLGLLLGCFLYFSSFTHILMLSALFQDYQTPGQQEKILKNFLKTKHVDHEPFQSITLTRPKLEGVEDIVFTEFLDQRDK